VDVEIVERTDAGAAKTRLPQQLAIVGQQLELRIDEVPYVLPAQFPVGGEIGEPRRQALVVSQIVGMLRHAAARKVVGRSA
jgi:hypothetical protein